MEAEQAAQKQAVIDTLSEQEQLTVRAMETAGLYFQSAGCEPWLKGKPGLYGWGIWLSHYF